MTFGTQKNRTHFFHDPNSQHSQQDILSMWFLKNDISSLTIFIGFHSPQGLVARAMFGSGGKKPSESWQHDLGIDPRGVPPKGNTCLPTSFPPIKKPNKQSQLGGFLAPLEKYFFPNLFLNFRILTWMSLSSVFVLVSYPISPCKAVSTRATYSAHKVHRFALPLAGIHYHYPLQAWIDDGGGPDGTQATHLEDESDPRTVLVRG